MDVPVGWVLWLFLELVRSTRPEEGRGEDTEAPALAVGARGGAQPGRCHPEQREGVGWEGPALRPWRCTCKQLPASPALATTPDVHGTKPQVSHEMNSYRYTRLP